MPRQEEVRFRAGDTTLSGSLTLPTETGDGRLPWALLVPSWLPRDRDGGWDREGHSAWFAPAGTDAAPGLLARLAAALAARGVASLRYDPRGCGESGGAWERADLFTRIDDARDAIGAMRSRPELDLRRTAIIGHGEGATIALSVAIGDPAIGAVALIGAGARSLRDLLRRGASARIGHPDASHPIVSALDRSAEELVERAERRETEMPLRIGPDEVRLALAAWEQGIHTPALALATMLHRPVVIVHGTDDRWAHPDEARLLAEALGHGGSEPHVDMIEAAGHDLREADDDRIESVAGAIADRMLPRELPPVLVAIEEITSGADRG